MMGKRIFGWLSSLFQCHKACLLCLQVLQQDRDGALSTASGTSTECALSTAGSAAKAWSPCGSTQTYASLEDGAYTFMARATSTSSITAQRFAISNFTVDTSAPSIQVRQWMTYVACVLKNAIFQAESKRAACPCCYYQLT